MDLETKPGHLLGKMDVLHSNLAKLGCSAREWGLVIFAADNGISLEQTSQFPALGSNSIVKDHLSGISPTARLLNRLGKNEYIIDIGLCEDIDDYCIIKHKVCRGSQNFLLQDALERSQVIAALSCGQAVVETIKKSNIDIVGIGEIGIGDTLCASALGVVATGFPINAMVGPGSAGSEMLNKKASLIHAALEYRYPESTDVVDMLSRFGGLEIAALTGFICALAQAGIPIMLDGFVTSIAALLASLMEDDVPRFLFSPSLAQEPGHVLILERLNLEPLFDLSLNYGEGLASVLGLFIAELSMSFYQ